VVRARAVRAELERWRREWEGKVEREREEREKDRAK